jgi:hypothetical protein
MKVCYKEDHSQIMKGSKKELASNVGGCLELSIIVHAFRLPSPCLNLPGFLYEPGYIILCVGNLKEGMSCVVCTSENPTDI